jgi:hypothetical protein
VNNPNRGIIDNKVLDGIAWGSFFILVGLVWILSTTASIDTGAYVAFGIGLILIAINLTRMGIGIKVSKFTLFIGIIALAIGVAGLIGYTLHLFATILILIGLFVFAEGLQKATQNKP